MPSHVEILGIPFYPITLDDACRTLDWMLSRQDGKMRITVTGNPIMVVNAGKDLEFRSIMRAADLLVPDGIGILWAARKLGKSLPEKVTGVDLADYLLNKKPAPAIFLLGGKPGVADRARARLQKERPWVKIVGTHDGYFSEDEELNVVDEIKASRAEVILAGMGSPRQEKFLWRHKDALGAKLGIGVGGVLDILSGDKVLAPENVRRIGLEWLYRLATEPGRIKADFKLLQFAVRIEAHALLSRGKRERGTDDRDITDIS